MRKLILRSGSLALVLIGLCGYAHATAPKVPTNAPYIVLSSNLDEPNGYGFCIDTLARGQTDLMQTHSCKPAKAGRARDDRDNDTRFTFDPATGQIASYAFIGVCMQALIAANTTVFALLQCSDHPRQKFTYNKADQTLRIAGNQDRCVSVAAETQKAGPWVKRALELTTCSETDASLKQWTVVPLP